MVIVLLVILLIITPQYLYAVVEHSIYETKEECIECHPRFLPTHLYSRPSNISIDLPLDAAGRITCFTCHDCTSGKCTFRIAKSDLCGACHDCNQGMSCSLGIAHLGSSINIDSLVNGCIACHDGFTGPFINPDGHMINAVYNLSEGFNILNEPTIILVDGKVTCISCHDPYKNEDNRLVKSNEGSRLCLTCHQK